ncbi:MAG: bifunctional diaminohydroxyphosphoribosylaminopyrimidine deaminase/5-amino-6-(5-phosphoribosylamino)uracil reductase RibD [bacterium]
MSPNPAVGACIVKDGRIVGEGYHQYFGGPHAEVNALKGLSVKDLKKATLYVTLEPCNHFGKTPPCTELIIEKGLKNVVVGVLDKNPLVSGTGIKRLIDSGVKVVTGVLEEELNQFYKPFFKHVTKNLPFVTLKVAQSLDGKNGVKGSKYLVTQKTLNYVHRLRYQSDAVMVGVNTVNIDNPRLDIRFYRKKPLKKVVLDYYGNINDEADIFKTGEEVIIYTCSEVAENLKRYKHVEVLKVGGKDGFVELNDVIVDLGRRGVVNLLVEGGSTLSFEMLKQRLVDRLILLVSPYIIGGTENIAFASEGFKSLSSAVSLEGYKLKRSDKDLIITKDLS